MSRKTSKSEEKVLCDTDIMSDHLTNEASNISNVGWV